MRGSSRGLRLKGRMVILAVIREARSARICTTTFLASPLLHLIVSLKVQVEQVGGFRLPTDTRTPWCPCHI